MDLSYQLDLDSSFKRILNEKRQMTNKENNPAAMPSAPEPSTHTNPIEKPIRRDLLKERILHRIHDDSLNLDNSTSYVCENSISTDMEYATINRLMADFNINRDSTIGQKRTPLKALRITGEVSIDDEAFMPGVRRLISPTLDARNSDANVSLRTEQKVETVNADDTLEEIEYVKTLDRGLNYIPKRLIEKQNEMQQSDDVQDENVPSENSTKNDDDNDQTNDDDDDVIVIESSPENSFTTTRNTGLFKSALESVDNTFYTAKSNFNSKSICSISIGDDSPAKNDSGKESISSNDDDDATMENKSFPPSSCNTSKNQSFDDFNDSLERIEYMMRQGAKFLNKPMTPVPKLLTPNKIDNKLAESPKARTPIGGAIKKVLPVSSGKKPVSKNGTPSKLDLFKRPIHSPHVQTRMPTKSKIPMLNNPVISSLTKPQFRHIASPIAAYIKNTPEVPLMKTIKASKNLDGADVYDKVGNKTNVLDETTQSVESFPVKSALPKKMYISAPQRQVKCWEIC